MLIAIAGLLFAYPSVLYADGQYWIGKDRGGVYMQTEQDGSWYIDKEHVNNFRVGEKGTYTTGVDTLGTYILLSKGRQFYIDISAHDQLQRRLEDVNQRQTQDGKMETKVVVEGSQVLVPVVLGYRGKETEVLLLLDTGASMIVIHREIAKQLNMRGIQKGQLTTAGGDAINADLVKLDSVKVGSITEKGVAAGIIEYKGPVTGHRGLLGMNFLKNISYRVNFEKQTIVWESRDSKK